MRYYNKDEKRGLHPVVICAILFLCAFFYSIIIVDNSYETEKLYSAMLIERDGDQDDGQNALENSGNLKDGERFLIAIDPGHGGNDPGKVSSDVVLEKDVNLQIAIILKI